MKSIGEIRDGFYHITADSSDYQSDGWPKGVPAFKGGESFIVLDGRNNSFVVQIERTSRDDLLTYTQILGKAGYRLKGENHIAGNIYFIYENGFTLVNAYYIENTKSVRITAEPAYQLTMETHGDCTAQPAIFASSISDRSYFIRLPDNSLVIIDGGWRIEDWTEFDHDELMQGFCDELRQIQGTERIHVRAWFITHPHSDHARFLEHAREMGYAKRFDVERIVFNIPSEKYLDTIQPFISTRFPNEVSDRVYIGLIEKELYRWQKLGATIIKARTGMKFSFAGMKFEVLLTPDDTLPGSFENVNGLSVLLRQSFCGMSIIWMGDMADKPSEIAIRMYGKHLKCDGLQVSHHGWGNAGVKEFYDLCSPSVQLWTNSEYGFLFFDKKQGYGKTEIATYVYDMPCTKRHVFCNRIHMEKIMLPLEDC